MDVEGPRSALERDGRREVQTDRGGWRFAGDEIVCKGNGGYIFGI